MPRARLLPGAGPASSRTPQVFQAPTMEGAAGAINRQLGYSEHSTPAPNALSYARTNPMSAHAMASGEFAHGDRLTRRLTRGPQYDVPDPMRTPVTSFEDHSRGDQQRIRAHASKLGLTPAIIRRNTGALIDAAQARAARQPGAGEHPTPLGRDWYFDEHNNIGTAARETGVSHGRLTGATAALSPTVPWESGGKPVNLNLARKVAGLVQSNPSITITQQHADHLTHVQDTDPASYAGRNPVNWHELVGTHQLSDLTSHQVATLGSFSGRAGHVNETDPETGEKVKAPSRTFGSHGIEPIKVLAPLAQARSRSNVTKALDIMRGGVSTHEAMNSTTAPKPRTFNDNLQAPYREPGRVTVDRWALRGVSGVTAGGDDSGIVGKMKVGKGRKSDPLPQASQTAQDQGLYGYVQHHIAQEAHARGMHAQEAQAIAWTQLKGQAEGFRQFGTALPHERDYGLQEAAGNPTGNDRARLEAQDSAIQRNRARSRVRDRMASGPDPAASWVGRPR